MAKKARIPMFKRRAISTAKQLFYPEECIDRIMNAENESEVCRIMITYRGRSRWI